MANDSSSEPHKLRVAIIGAGLVGSVAAIALSKLNNVAVTVFERAPAARETGASININASALYILDRIAGLEKLGSELFFRPARGAAYITHWWRTGEVIKLSPSPSNFADRYIQARARRVELLASFLRHVPEGTIQYGKTVVGTTTTDAGVTVRFVDESSQLFDLVVAADGIYSKIRRQYLPDQKISYKGTVSYRKVYPSTLFKHIENLPTTNSVWCGPSGDLLFLGPVGGNGFSINVIRKEPQDEAERLRWASLAPGEVLAQIKQAYLDWDPVVPAILEALPDIDSYPLEVAPWMDDLVRDDCVAFVGDAAHPTSGVYGAGASMGIADVWALSRSLDHTQLRRHGATGHLYDLPRALSLFNESRRHFLKRVERQMLLDKRNFAYIAGAGTDEIEWMKRFREKMSQQWWLTGHDVEAEWQKTLDDEAYWKAGGDL